jgi:hypothetical protein
VELSDHSLIPNPKKIASNPITGVDQAIQFMAGAYRVESSRISTTAPPMTSDKELLVLENKSRIAAEIAQTIQITEI